jgi:PAS domain S-box-containing protein
LILNETSGPAINTIDEGIRAGLQGAPYRLEFYREYMETVLFPDPAIQQEFRDLYLRKYQNRKPDVIIAVGPSPLEFMLKTHERAFASVPVIFCLPYGSVPDTLRLDPGITGVTNVVEPAATLEVVLRLKPETKHVIIVGGTSPLDRQTEAMVQQGLRSYAGQVDISYLTNLTMPALLTRLMHVPRDAIILFIGITQDAAGTPFPGTESAPAVTAAASAPVFVLTDSFLGHGEVGGKLFTRFEQGKVTGNMVLKVLTGEKPKDIPVVNGVSQYMFDWRALQHWGLSESNLPPSSIVLNRQPTLWEASKWYILGGISIILVEALLISGLIFHRSRLKAAESKLRVANQQLAADIVEHIQITETLRQKDRELVEAQRLAGVGSWRWDARNDIVTWSEELYRIVGFDATLPAPKYKEHPAFFTAASWQRLDRAAEKALRDGTPYELDLEVVRPDGTTRWVRTHGEAAADTTGGVVQLRGTVQDITERKLADEVLAGMSRKLLEAQEQERSRIGRELHDDINQRLALLSVEIQRMKEVCPGMYGELRSRMDEIGKRTSEISAGVQSLSHELHSSKLEYLGLVSAMKGFCKEFGGKHKVEIDFSSEGIPSDVPPEISLCLFRVMQEGLQNALKHSGVRFFAVKMHGLPTEIQLTVRDSGVGFDPELAKDTPGLGLVSMQERIRLVKGTISITSRPQSGSEINVRVPLSAGVQMEQAKLAGA